MFPNFSFFSIASKIFRVIILIGILYMIYIFLTSVSGGDNFLKKFFESINNGIKSLYDFIRSILSGKTLNLNSLLN